MVEYIKIPMDLYRQLMSELKEKAETEVADGKYDLRKIEEIRKTIKKFNKKKRC